MAEEVIRMPEPVVRRQEDEEEILQTKEYTAHTPEVNPGLESGIQTLRGGGQPLPESVRAYSEPRLDYDFGQVRVHTDDKAAEAAKSVNAKTFTTGKEVVFQAGQYSPETSTGKRLHAHELTHVAQQSGEVLHKLTIGRSGDACEGEAHHVAADAVM